MKNNKKTVFRKIVDTHNVLSDKNLIWFPFIFLKPKPETLINQKRILIMTLCFGSYAAIAFVVRSYLNNTLSLILSLKTLLYANLGFFIWFQVVTSRLWNIRAKELSK